jgi:hypothetical protein
MWGRFMTCSKGDDTCLHACSLPYEHVSLCQHLVTLACLTLAASRASPQPKSATTQSAGCGFNQLMAASRG